MFFAKFLYLAIRVGAWCVYNERKIVLHVFTKKQILTLKFK